MNLKLEVIVLPVADVDRAKPFYEAMGFREDVDYAANERFRVVQFTPPGSECSIIIGKGVTPATPGSVQGLFLVVDDIEEARAELVGREINVGRSFTAHWGKEKPLVPIRNDVVMRPLPPSLIRMATAGCSRK